MVDQVTARHRLIPVFIKFIRQVSNDKDTILDVGCGSLRDAFHRCLGSRYKGLDLPERPDPKDYEGNAEALPFPDDSFDMVTAWSVLEHLENPFIALLEMVRVARKTILVSTDYTERDKNQSDNHMYCWTQKIFNQFLSRPGFKIKVWMEDNVLYGLIWKSHTEDSSEK